MSVVVECDKQEWKEGSRGGAHVTTETEICIQSFRFDPFYWLLLIQTKLNGKTDILEKGGIGKRPATLPKRHETNQFATCVLKGDLTIQ